MSDTYYVQIRGRVHGPMDRDKLDALVRRGQVGRSHQISSDGQTWERMADHPELMNARVPEQTVVAAPEAAVTQETARDDFVVAGTSERATKGPSAPTASAGWYYTDGDDQTGPVDLATLRQYIMQGQLSPDVEVWSEQLADWMPASSVPSLAVSGSSTFGIHTKDPSATQKDGVGTGVVRALRDSKPWVTFLSILGFISAFFLTIWGLWFVIVGSRHGAPMIIAIGLSSIVTAVLHAVGSYFLLRYCSDIASFVSTKREAKLQAALETLKTFWIYVGILMIITIAFATVGLIITISAAGSITPLSY